jgi:hypothetical protein
MLSLQLASSAIPSLSGGESLLRLALLFALPVGKPPGRVVDEIERLGARISSLEVTQEGERRRLELNVALPRETPAPHLGSRIANLENVAEVRWND